MVGRLLRRWVFTQARALESWLRSSSPNARSKKRACARQLSSPVSGASGEPAEGCMPAMKRTVSSTSPLAVIAPVISTWAGGRGIGPVRRESAGDWRVAGGPQPNGLKSQLAAGSDERVRRAAETTAAFRMRIMEWRFQARLMVWTGDGDALIAWDTP